MVVEKITESAGVEYISGETGPHTTTGWLTFLRVHQLLSGYGPPNDRIDGEVVIKFAELPGEAFGFKLRDDADGPAHEGMFSLLKLAYINQLYVSIDYMQVPGNQNGRIVRVWLERSEP